MTSTHQSRANHTAVHEPVEAVVERLNDPAVAASLVTLLDNAELLSTLVIGLSAAIERSDTIMDSVTAGMTEMNDARRGSGDASAFPGPAEIARLATALTRSTPVIQQVLDSSMVSSDTVALLSLMSGAAVEGAERARRSDTSVAGVRATLRALKDPDVARGLGLFVEIARSLGRHLDDASADTPARPTAASPDR